MKNKIERLLAFPCF